MTHESQYVLMVEKNIPFERIKKIESKNWAHPYEYVVYSFKVVEVLKPRDLKINKIEVSTFDERDYQNHAAAEEGGISESAQYDSYKYSTAITNKKAKRIIIFCNQIKNEFFLQNPMAFEGESKLKKIREILSDSKRIK